MVRRHGFFVPLFLGAWFIATDNGPRTTDNLAMNQWLDDPMIRLLQGLEPRVVLSNIVELLFEVLGLQALRLAVNAWDLQFQI